MFSNFVFNQLPTPPGEKFINRRQNSGGFSHRSVSNEIPGQLFFQTEQCRKRPGSHCDCVSLTGLVGSCLSIQYHYGTEEFAHFSERQKNCFASSKIHLTHKLAEFRTAGRFARKYLCSIMVGLKNAKPIKFDEHACFPETFRLQKM